MNIFNYPFFKKYLLPGFVFQSVVIAGGYGTGRELVEYFLQYGPWGGILGMFLITTLFWSLFLAVTFEFSRKFKVYDYRSFFKKLLGPLWFLFEIPYFIFLLLVLAVIGSAAGVLLEENFRIPYMTGVLIMLAAVGFLTFKGSWMIERFLSSWSMILYLVYGIFFVVALLKFGPFIQKNFSQGPILPQWPIGGFKYALYNLGVIPAVFFCLPHIEKRKESFLSGILAGIIGILPAFLFYVSVVSQYPLVLPEEIPAVYILQKLGLPGLLILYQVVLFGTLIETGTGLIHSVNERIHSAFKARGKKFRPWHRPLVAVGFLLLGVGIASFGLIALIAQGYGTMSWGFFIVFFVPLMTLGVYKIIKN